MSDQNTSRTLTLRQTFSFYVSGRDPNRIRTCAELADSVVVSGSSGPKTVNRLRKEGWKGIVLFDRAAYTNPTVEIDLPSWFDEQVNAGADRLLTPGCWVGSESGHLPFDAQIDSELALAIKYDATCTIAIDHRWLTKPSQLDEMILLLKGIDQPVALILGDTGDPLGYPRAVDALIALTKGVDRLSILRSDHGAIGALAFDAIHASIGLTTSHRHSVPPRARAYRTPNDQSVRVFVKDLMDWFTASTIGGWSTTRIIPECNLACCNGQRIDRFLNERLRTDADLHNRTSLSDLAEQILATPPDMRRRAFGKLCYEAIERYGIMGGLTSQIIPKQQLKQWAQYI